MATYPDFDIIIKFENDRDAWSTLQYTFNGGKKWFKHNLYNEPHIVIQHLINRFAIFDILNPSLENDENLCRICATNRKVGIVKYKGRTWGTEKQCVMRIDEDGEYVAVDEEFYVEYHQWQCNRCHNISYSD